MKLTVRLRSGVMVMPPMITSNLPAKQRWNDAVPGGRHKLDLDAHVLCELWLATSISKPISSPSLSRIAHGTKVDMPTLEARRFA